jgi:hypothetical protein
MAQEILDGAALAGGWIKQLKVLDHIAHGSRISHTSVRAPDEHVDGERGKELGVGRHQNAGLPD